MGTDGEKQSGPGFDRENDLEALLVLVTRRANERQARAVRVDMQELLVISTFPGKYAERRLRAQGLLAVAVRKGKIASAQHVRGTSEFLVELPAEACPHPFPEKERRYLKQWRKAASEAAVGKPGDPPAAQEPPVATQQSPATVQPEPPQPRPAKPGHPDATPVTPQVLFEAERQTIREHLLRIPALSPREIEKRLIASGYRGQEVARRCASTLAYRHLRRLRAIYVENRPTEGLAPCDRYLFLGPTGCGKTYLVETIFREILAVPTLVTDMTTYSEVGYVGDDANVMLQRLVEGAGGSRALASIGVICMDEFDKLAASQSSTRFAGAGTTKDVSGYGVQRGLLNLLSGKTGSLVDPCLMGRTATRSLPLENLLFIACGAFSGIGEVRRRQAHDQTGIGFQASTGADPNSRRDLPSDESERTLALTRYGILPELVGRFSRIVEFQSLSAAELRRILETVVGPYRAEFASEGIELEVGDSVLSEIVQTALQMGTGARGLRAALVPRLEEAAFSHFGGGNVQDVRRVCL